MISGGIAHRCLICKALAIHPGNSETHFLHQTASAIKSEVNRPSSLAVKALGSLVQDELFHLLVSSACRISWFSLSVETGMHAENMKKKKSPCNHQYSNSTSSDLETNNVALPSFT